MNSARIARTMAAIANIIEMAISTSVRSITVDPLITEALMRVQLRFAKLSYAFFKFCDLTVTFVKIFTHGCGVLLDAFQILLCFLDHFFSSLDHAVERLVT